MTIGNGLRYGPRYLVAATGGALTVLCLAWAYNNYWQANPLVVLTLGLTAILVPACIYALLIRVQTAYNTHRVNPC